MSNYGRLWQRVADIRAELKRLVSHADTDSLEKAERTCADSIITARDAWNHTRANRIEDLLSAWADLERRMAQCED